MSSLIIRIDAIKNVCDIRFWDMPLQFDQYIGVTSSMGSHDFNYLDEIGLVGLTTDENGKEYYKDYCLIECHDIESIKSTLEICPWLTLGDKDYIVYMTGTDSKYLNEVEYKQGNSIEYFKNYLKDAIIKAKENSKFSIKKIALTSDVFRFNNKNYNYKELLNVLLIDNVFPYFLIINVYDYKLGVVYFQITTSPTKTNSFENCNININESKSVYLVSDTYENSSLIKSPWNGIVKFEENDVVKELDYYNTVISDSSEIIVIDNERKKEQKFHLTCGAKIEVNNGSTVKEGDLIVSWDPYTIPIISKKQGTTHYVDLIDEISMRTFNDENTGISSTFVIPIDQSEGKKNLVPRIYIKDDKDVLPNLLEEKEDAYFLSANTALSVENGEEVKVGSVLGRIPIVPSFAEGQSFSIGYKFILGEFYRKYSYSKDMENRISEYKGTEMGFNQLFSYKTSYKNDLYRYKHDECLDGPSEVRQENGLLWSSMNYKENKLDGLCEYFHENGNLQEKNIWDDGKLIFHEKYDSDNNIIFKGNFVDETSGKRKGLWKSFYDDSSLQSQGHYVDNKKHGEWSYHGKGGSLIKTEIWVNGTKNS